MGRFVRGKRDLTNRQNHRAHAEKELIYTVSPTPSHSFPSGGLIFAKRKMQLIAAK
jgi:hypothetical protein